MSMERAERGHAERVSGVPNVAFDLVTVLHEKLQAIAAYEIYKEDARQAGDRKAETFFDQCQQADRTMCDQLREMVAQNLQSGPTWRSQPASSIMTPASQQTH